MTRERHHGPPSGEPNRRQAALPSPGWLPAALTIAFFAAGAAIRFAIIFPVTKFQADADCIQTGLCALRILAGDLQVFYNGVRIGAIESYLHALAFLALGPTRQAMGFAPWIASSLGMVFTWLFVRRLAGPRAALWGLALVAVPAPAFVYWTVQPNGYSVTMALAAATLWLAAWVADEPERRGVWFGFGLVVGLSWWASLQTLCTTLPAAAWLAWRLMRSNRGEPTRALLRRTVPLAVLALAGFLVGASPWIAFNVRHPFGSFNGANSVAQPARDREAVEDNLSFLTGYKLPELFVSTDPEGGPNPPRPLTRALHQPASAIYLIAFAWFLIRGDHDAPDGGGGTKRRRALALLLLATTIGINVLSVAGASRGLTVRYVLPIYLLAPLAVGLFLAALARARPPATALASGALVALLGAFSASVYFWPGSVMRERLHVAASGEWQTLALLRKNGVEVVVGDYWLVYPINFASREWIRGISCDRHADLYHYGDGLAKAPQRFALLNYSPDAVKAQAARAGISGEVTFLAPSYAVLIADAPASDATPQEFIDRVCGKRF